MTKYVKLKDLNEFTVVWRVPEQFIVEIDVLSNIEELEEFMYYKAYRGLEYDCERFEP